jgi:hypothetical protein
MHKAISLGLLAGVAALAASLSSPASATPTALSLQQGQASAGVVEGGRPGVSFGSAFSPLASGRMSHSRQ